MLKHRSFNYRSKNIVVKESIVVFVKQFSAFRPTDALHSIEPNLDYPTHLNLVYVDCQIPCLKPIFFFSICWVASLKKVCLSISLKLVLKSRNQWLHVLWTLCQTFYSLRRSLVLNVNRVILQGFLIIIIIHFLVRKKQNCCFIENSLGV